MISTWFDLAMLPIEDLIRLHQVTETPLQAFLLGS